MEGAVNNDIVARESQEESKFAGVVFRNIQDVYVPGKDIRCCYSIKPYVSTTENDWIGLYKVGWQSPKDYLCYEYSPVLEKASLTASLSAQDSVVFRGSKLPSEECEFYQFCYVTSSGEIRGASCPFQISFSKPGDLEICSEEEDESLLIVSNRTTHLEDSLAKALDENASLKASKEKAEGDYFKLQDIIIGLEAKESDMVFQNQKQKKMLDKAISEKTALEESYRNTLEQLETTQTSLKLANRKTSEALQQLYDERNQNVQESSQKFEEEHTHLLEVISQKERTIQELLISTEQSNANSAALESEIQKLIIEKGALQESYHSLVLEKAKSDEALKKSEQAYVALEKSQAKDVEQVYCLQRENTRMKEELALFQVQMEEMSDQFSNQQSLMEENHLREYCKLEKTVETMRVELDRCKQELNQKEESLAETITNLDNQAKANQLAVKGYEDSIVKLQEQLNQERAFNNSLSSASDHQVAELQEQLNAQLQKNSLSLALNEKQTQEIKRLEENIKLNEADVERMQREIKDQGQHLEIIKMQENENIQQNSNNGNGGKSAALEGPYFALKTAHEQLRKQYWQVKKDMENLWRQKADLKRQLASVHSELPDSDLRFEMANLKKQNEDLRIRLNMGAEAYKAKFKECQKYEKQLKKAQKESDSSPVPQCPSSVTEFEIRNLKQLLENEKTTAAALRKSLENYKADEHGLKQELGEVNRSSLE